MTIKGMIFDLDGVLVQTEKLKSLAYAKAVQKIRDLEEPDFTAADAYREVVGAPRETTSTHVMNKLGLEDDLRPFMSSYNVSRPVEALTAIRYEIYYEMVGDPQVIRDNKWPHAVEVLKVAKENLCRTALATLSKRKDVDHVISSLGIKELLDVIVTAEDVTNGKPDPEIYLTAAKKLGLSPDECLVLEDSVNGVKAGLAAGMHVVGIATPFTASSLLRSRVLGDQWISKPEEITMLVQKMIDGQIDPCNQDGPIIVPGIIAANQKELDRMLGSIDQMVKRVMFDVMDGRFVPNHSLDFDFKIKKEKGICYEAHLMTCTPCEWIERNADKVDIAIIHVEPVLKDISSAIGCAKNKGLKVYLALNPDTKIDVVRPFLKDIDGVLVLTVHPGRYSAPFQKNSLEKVRSLRQIARELPIEVDGAMNPRNVKKAKKAGATIFASGSYIMKSDYPIKAIKELEEAAR